MAFPSQIDDWITAPGTGRGSVCGDRRAIAGSLGVLPGRVPGVRHDNLDLGKAQRIGAEQPL